MNDTSLENTQTLEMKSFEILLSIEDNLKGHILPEEKIIETRYVLMRRFKTKFSKVLSPEGRLAMEQAAKIYVTE
jgi:hypothetical protein